MHATYIIYLAVCYSLNVRLNIGRVWTWLLRFGRGIVRCHQATILQRLALGR